jgi:hypothetical protein
MDEAKPTAVAGMNYDELQNLIEKLRKKVFRGPTMEAGHTKTIEWQAADELEAQLDLIAKQQKIIRRIYVDHFPDTYFVSGEIGHKDQNGLPEYIEVCPAYGVDWTQLYQRTDRTIGGMGS